MKNLLTLIIIFLTFKLYSQKTYYETFIYENSSIKYSFYDVSNKPANTFFIFINYKKNIEKCFKNKYMRHYFLDMPENISKEKQEELFLELVHDITSKAKLLESDFYIVADKDYTALYRDMLNKEHRYKGSYINDINNIYINPPETEICKMLQ